MKNEKWKVENGVRQADAAFRVPVPTLDELAAQHGVKPISDTETLRGKDIWPEEDDIDEFVETIQRWRREETIRHD